MNSSATTPDLILHHGRFTTLDRANPTASAVAIADGKFTAVGRDEEIVALAGPVTRIIDLSGRNGLPGHIDPFVHLSAPLEGADQISLLAGRNASERPEKRPLEVIIIDKSDC